MRGSLVGTILNNAPLTIAAGATVQANDSTVGLARGRRDAQQQLVGTPVTWAATIRPRRSRAPWAARSLRKGRVRHPDADRRLFARRHGDGEWRHASHRRWRDGAGSGRAVGFHRQRGPRVRHALGRQHERRDQRDRFPHRGRRGPYRARARPDPPGCHDSERGLLVGRIFNNALLTIAAGATVQANGSTVVLARGSRDAQQQRGSAGHRGWRQHVHYVLRHPGRLRAFREDRGGHAHALGHQHQRRDEVGPRGLPPRHGVEVPGTFIVNTGERWAARARSNGASRW